jgi:hypothetical protein
VAQREAEGAQSTRVTRYRRYRSGAPRHRRHPEPALLRRPGDRGRRPLGVSGRLRRARGKGLSASARRRFVATWSVMPVSPPAVRTRRRSPTPSGLPDASESQGARLRRRPRPSGVRATTGIPACR